MDYNTINVIYVDDDDNICIFMEDSFEPFENINLTCFTKSNDVLEYLSENNDTDIVISDIRMPDMDGIQLAKEIRNNINQDIKIVLTSGFSNVSKQSMNSFGIEGFIQKPFTIESIKEYLESEFAHKIKQAA